MYPRQPLGLFLCFCSVFFVVFGLFLIGLRTVLYQTILRSQMVLRPNSEIYQMWVKNPVPLSLKFYVFNWTNPENINNATVKPRFVELGPYYYNEVFEKTNITWNANDTVTYKNLKTWWFDQSQSNGSHLDPLTTVNPVALSAAYRARYWNYMMRKGVSFVLQSVVRSLIITQPVGHTIFEGYEDPLVSIASKMPFIFKDKLPFSDKFSWFYGRNGSEDYEGVYNMGAGKYGQIGELKSWNNKNDTMFYSGKCNHIQNGSAGEFFPTNLQKDSVIKFFSADLCRYVELEFEEEVIISGLIGYKYSAGERFLDNGTNVPDNKCYCDGDFMPSGVLNVSNCKLGTPGFISLPHFYKADPYYVDSIEGMHPSKEKGDFYMIFEPNLGIPLQVSAKLQLNLLLQPIDGITMYSNVPTVYIPVLFFEQYASIPMILAFLVKLLLNFEVICCAVGFLFIVLGSLIYVFMSYKICSSRIFKKKKQKKSTLLQEEMPLNMQ